MKPSSFLSQPMDSITQSSEAETIARNIMVILSRTGDSFRRLEWIEYQSERLKDGNFSDREKLYFNQVVAHCASEETAKLFSSVWANASEKPTIKIGGEKNGLSFHE